MEFVGFVEFFLFFYLSGGGPGMGFARVLEPSKGCWLFLLVETAPRAPSSRKGFTFWLFLVMDKTMVSEKKLCAEVGLLCNDMERTELVLV